ncbi:hypothetical protein CMO88_04275 [Candidatus Woesearchaeota archaeon]|nr:hypothetical protein [Candidatus Woesearchaeota archaeon]|tara:strand:- start:1555 stop:2754 length:1200 start_codon:yes stop_codon:yes gene_type:complete
MTSNANGLFNITAVSAVVTAGIEPIGPNMDINKTRKAPQNGSLTTFSETFYTGFTAFPLFMVKDGIAVLLINSTYAAFVVDGIRLDSTTGIAQEINISYRYNANGSNFFANPPTSGCGVHTTETTCYAAATTGAGCYWDFWLEICNEATGGAGGAAVGGGSGVGGGGGGGGNATSKFASKATRFWDLIAADDQKLFSVKSEKISVSLLTFTLSKEAENVEVTVGTLKTLPSTVTEPEITGYQNLQVTHKNIENADVSSVTIEFDVTLDWLTTNSLSTQNVALYRYDETAKSWNGLATTHLRSDSEKAYYSSTSSGLSYFVVGVKQKAAVVEEEAEKAETFEEITGATVQDTGIEEATEPEPSKGGLPAWWMYAALTGAVIGIAIVLGGWKFTHQPKTKV